MTILVDMDDTIEQLIQAWVDGVNREYGRNAAYEDVTDWNVSKAFPGLTWEQVYAVSMRPGFWRDVAPMPGAAIRGEKRKRITPVSFTRENGFPDEKRSSGNP